MRPKKNATKKQFLSRKSRCIITIFTVALFVFYCLSFNGDKLDDVVPAHWYFYRTSIRREMPLNQYLETVRYIRE